MVKSWFEYISESIKESDWTTPEDDINELLIGLKDVGADINISSVYINEDFSRSSNVPKVGYFPGYKIVVDPKNIDKSDFDGLSDLYKELAESIDRFEDRFGKIGCDVVRGSLFTFTFLDDNSKSFTWNKDLLAKEDFMDNFNIGLPALRYGQSKKSKDINTHSFKIEYTQPVGVNKSILNLNQIKEYVHRRFPNYNFEISEDLDKSYLTPFSTKKSGMSKGINVKCLGSK